MLPQNFEMNRAHKKINGWVPVNVPYGAKFDSASTEDSQDNDCHMTDNEGYPGHEDYSEESEFGSEEEDLDNASSASSVPSNTGSRSGPAPSHPTVAPGFQCPRCHPGSVHGPPNTDGFPNNRFPGLPEFLGANLTEQDARNMLWRLYKTSLNRWNAETYRIAVRSVPFVEGRSNPPEDGVTRNQVRNWFIHYMLWRIQTPGVQYNDVYE